MLEEYEPQELEHLVEAALGVTADAASTAVFDYGGTKTFEVLYPLLRDYLHPADVTAVLDRLRDQVADGIASDKPRSERLQALHGIQSACTMCTGVKREPTLPHWNRNDPDLLIVTDQPLNITPNGDLLIQAMKQAGFSSDHVCATAIVRCPTLEKKVQKNHVSNCVSRYLFTEIPLLAPRLILACGSLAASTLAAEQVKVTENNGTIFWVGPWPVMMTISPGYASHSDARRDALFSDLQQAYHFLYG